MRLARLAELRRANNITQKELAGKLKCSQNMISQWENGTRDPNTSTLNEIALIFDVSIDYLLGVSEKAEPHVEDQLAQKIADILMTDNNEDEQTIIDYLSLNAEDKKIIQKMVRAIKKDAGD